MSEPYLATRIRRVLRRLKAKNDFIRSRNWDHPETMDVTGINRAAAELGLGPVLAIGNAPSSAYFPNLISAEAVQGRPVDCLVVYHPADDSEHRICREGMSLDDESSLVVDETIDRLEAWIEQGFKVSARDPAPPNDAHLTSEHKLNDLPPASRISYLAYQAAERQAGGKLTDREAYDLLGEGISNADFSTDDWKIPQFETFARQLRVARKSLGENKHNKRAGRRAGRSIVKHGQH